MKSFAVILIISVLIQLATECSSQFLGTALAGNRGAISSASADAGWSSGYGVRGGSGYNSMPMDPLSGPYPAAYNSYPQMGSPFMPSPGLGFPPSGLGVPPPGLGLPSSGLGSPVGYGGFNSPFGVGLPFSPMGPGSYNDANALAMGGPSPLAFQQPAYAMPMMAQPQSTQMTENDNANTNININHDMGLHHPGMPKGLLGLARM
ncbi:postacrosomal sheath WW domain-binding protein-like [Cotesia glomerata]|uniref:Uncharacterized protein n=1 Tax=Cotesia glomerata TaxID=32391 RepID=A0AAV7IQ24_COTGL|nr:postacrosomal sheath WW domain-binding protein-like [Cotesia glomerata]KAH0557396.1 hypothetical protein KQX54_005329 [Cotesia glomerata]